MLAKKNVLTSLELFVIRDLEVRRKKIENLSSSAHFVHTTAKKVVSRRRNNENGGFFVYSMQISEAFAVILVA